jgi:hypothetical protein
MKILRKEDLSLHRYIKDFALRDFVEKEEQSSLELLPDLSCEGSYIYQTMESQLCIADSEMFPLPSDKGRGWVFFDCPVLDVYGYCDNTTNDQYVLVSGTDALGTICYGTPEQSNRVVVYDENFITIDASNYVIDYIDGRIIFDSSDIVPSYVDFHWNYVSVMDEWPNSYAPDAPVVVIAIDETKKQGYQLGAGRHNRRKANLHIFASSAGERNDLVETLYDALYLKCAPVYDFTTGDVLDADGTFYGRKENSNKLTSIFNRTSLNDLGTLHGGMTFHDVEARNVKTGLLFEGYHGAVQASQLNAYRATISFEIQSYTRQ